MTTIRDISSREALSDLCAMVYKHPAFAIDGKPRCWHKWKYSRWVEHEGTINNVVYCFVCEKCQATFRKDLLSSLPSNPDLLHDLNAVHELEMIAVKNHQLYDIYHGLKNVHGENFRMPFAPAHIRLEALATVLDVTCGECGGRGGHPANDYDSPDTWYLTRCPVCHGEKRVPIIDQWERKWREHGK